MADCTASYTVKQFEPPTVSCSANPSTVAPGDSSTITATGMSPQNRPLTYSYSASAGSVSGTTSTATLSTAGAAPGTITVTCNVVDDKGQTCFVHDDSYGQRASAAASSDDERSLLGQLRAGCEASGPCGQRSQGLP